MGYKRKTFGNKKVFAASAVGLLSLCAIIGGVMIKDNEPEKKNDSYVVDLNEEAGSVGINNSKPVEKETTSFLESEFEENESKTEKETSDSLDNEEVTSDYKESSNTEVETTTKKDKIEKPEEVTTADKEEVGITGTDVGGLNFSKHSTLVWPVEGQVIIDYDMENVVYFPTLDVYKCSDSVCVQAKEGTPVYAGANATVLEISKNNEIGNYVRLNLGNGYEVVYGSLKDIQVSGGLTIKEGDLIGYIAKPTKYYSLEGPNLYIKMTENGNSIDPLDYLNYE